MPKKNVIAIDYSGSTNRNKKYWQNVYAYVSKTNAEDTQFIFWDNRQNPEVVSREQALAKADKGIGYGGTNPGTFIQHLVSDKEGIILSIFTDGQVGSNEVDKCDRFLNNKDIKIKQLKVFFIGSKGDMNLSVSAPFMRAERIPDAGMDCEIKVNDEIITNETLKPTLSQIEKYWGKPELFLEQADSFLKELTLQNLGRNNQDMIFRNKLVELQKNLLQVVAENKKSGELKNKQDDLMLALFNKDEKSAMNGLKDLFENSTDETEKQIEDYFQKIFTLLDKKSDYSFDQLSSNRLTRAPEVKKVGVEEVEDIPTLEVKFECPITFEDDLPVLYIKNCYQNDTETSRQIKKYPPILQDISKQYQDYLISNPMAILENPELVSKIKKRFDQVIGLNTTVALCKNDQPLISLVTRESISSFISTSDEPSHQQATHYALADLFFGKKLCGVPELWLAVVYFIAKDTEHLNTENNFSHFLENFKNNLISQLKNNDTYMTLSGLSTHGPLLKVPVALALWYCVVSPKLENVPNRLRAIGTQHHLNLLDELDYPYDRKWTLHQLTIYKVFNWMYALNKAENTICLTDWIRCFYQNHLRLSDGTVCFLDGGPNKENLEALRVSFRKVEKIFTFKDFQDLQDLNLAIIDLKKADIHANLPEVEAILKEIKNKAPIVKNVEKIEEIISDEEFKKLALNDDLFKIKNLLQQTDLNKDLTTFDNSLMNARNDFLSHDFEKFNIHSARLNKIHSIRDIESLKKDIQEVEQVKNELLNNNLTSLNESIKKMLAFHASNVHQQFRASLNLSKIEKFVKNIMQFIADLDKLYGQVHDDKKPLILELNNKIKKSFGQHAKKFLVFLQRMRIVSEPLLNHQYDCDSSDFVESLLIKEVLELSKLIIENKNQSVGNIAIPLDLVDYNIPLLDASKNYNDKENTTKREIELCPLTFRPWSTVGNKNWQDLSEETFGPLSGQISVYNYFIRYVTEENKFPSKEEFIKWIAEKQAQRENDRKDTLPMHIATTVDNLFEGFTTAAHILFSDVCSNKAKDLFKNFEKGKISYEAKESLFRIEEMSIELFKEITERSRSKVNRVELESKYKTLELSTNDSKVINVSGFFTNRTNQAIESPPSDSFVMRFISK